MSRLLNWISSPRPDRGLRFLGDTGKWTLCDFESLTRRCEAFGSRILDAKVGPNEVVCILLPTGPEFFSAIYGTWIAGGTICPIVPPMMFEDEGAYVAHASRILRAAAPKAVVTDSAYHDLVKRILGDANRAETVVIDADDITEANISPKRPGEVALLQFTSGSSGAPRGVKVTFENLNSNIEAIRRWIHMGPNDATATWLPLYHDMGLIGCLITPTVNQSDVWIMRPDQFVREPIRWLECFGRRYASLCAAPNFGYGYAARKVPRESLIDMDFSGWRVAIAGAEPVDAQSLTLFSALLEPFGFSIRAFLPAYGLAEATLAVTGGSPKRAARAAQLDWDSLAFGESVSILKLSELGDIECENSSGWLVSSGTPHSGTDVRILGDNGIELPPDTLGEIFVGGPSVADGYSDNQESGATRFEGGGVLTGDAGFIHDGELFVVGRMADSMKIRGRTVYADDLEARLSSVTGVRRGRFVVIAVPGERISVLSIAEQTDEAWALKAAKVLKNILGETVGVKVAIGPRGIIQRTSSGKPRRRVMWQLDKSGELQFQHVVEL